MNNMGDLMKKAQQMQEEMKKAQEEAAKAEITGEAGAGLVKVTMNGRHDVRKVDIDPSLPVSYTHLTLPTSDLV